MSEAALSDEQILERLGVFKSERYPPDECVSLAEYLVDYCRGTVTKEAIATLVENFPDDRLLELLPKHVDPSLRSPGVDYCRGQHRNILAIALGKRDDFEVRSGWRVAWPGGVLKGEDLCRLALLAVWLWQIDSTKPKL